MGGEAGGEVEAGALHERAVIITDGARPTAVGTLGCAPALVAIADDVLVSRDDVVDDTGAGDSFLGGVLAGRAKGMGICEAVRVGHWAAAHVVRRRGASFEQSQRCPLLLG